jgi:superfamily II DNA helicase RecQ
MAARRPSNERELLDVPGVGPAKLDKYGDAFLAAVRDAG